MGRLFIMMGAPGCGKSTWCKNYIQKGDVYISRDEIRFSMLKDGDDYFSKEKAVYKEFIKQINKALRNDDDVYVDQTSLNRAARAKLLNSLEVQPDSITVVYIKEPLKVILERNAQRSGRALVPESAVINMYNSIELPTAEEGITWLWTVENGKINMKFLPRL